MRIIRYCTAFLSMSLVTACDKTPDPPMAPSLQLSGNSNTSLVTGDYVANIGAAAPIYGAYNLDGRTDKNGMSSGAFTFFAPTSTGTIDFAGRVTCLYVDDVLKRVWIGAVITRNSSTRAAYDATQEIHQVGHDVWFRVADRSPGGSGDPDRTTFLGFEGSGGIATSAEYCALHLWGNDGVGITSGNLTVH